jgi:hypothetical protein
MAFDLSSCLDDIGLGQANRVLLSAAKHEPLLGRVQRAVLGTEIADDGAAPKETSMANKVNAVDPNNIDISQPHEVQYWSETIGCTPEELIEAVNAVGTSVVDVSRHLQADQSPAKAVVIPTPTRAG